MKSTHIAVYAAIVAASVASTVNADTFAERNYAYGGLGIFQFSDKFYGESLGTGVAIEGGANFNIAPKIDAEGNFKFISASKNGFTWSRFDIGGNGTYWFMPGGQINPFAGGGLFLANYSLDYEFSGFSASESESKLGLKFYGGAELDLVPELWLRGAMSVEFVNSENTVSIYGLGGYKFTDAISAYSKLEFWFDPSVILFTVGGTYKF